MASEKNSLHKTPKSRLVLCVELLKSFEKDELNRFFTFINSPYFNTNKKLCQLLKMLRMYALDSLKFSEGIQLKVYQQVYGASKSQNNISEAEKKNLNKLLNKLLSLAEEFLVIEELKLKSESKHELLFPALIKRKQMVLYNRRLKAIQRELDNEKKQGVDYHTKQYHLQQYKEGLWFTEDRLTRKDNYDELQYHLDVKYLLEKLQYHLAKITLLKIYPGKTFDFKPFKAIKNLLNLSNYQKNPLIQLYLLNIDLVEKDDDETYLALFSQLKMYLDTIPAAVLKPFYTNLTNYCGVQIMKGNTDFYQNLYNIYQDMHAGNLYMRDDVITTRLLKNVITVGCYVKAFSWANEILEHYIPYVKNNIRKSVLNYNKGIIMFNQQKYNQALNYLKEVSKIDDIHDIGLRIVILQCFYETDVNYELSTQQSIESIKAYFINNKKLKEETKFTYINFINVFNSLYKFKDLPNKSEKQLKIKNVLPKIKNTIINEKAMRGRQWLLYKVNEIESMYS